MTKVVGVRFRQVGKIYFFAPGKYSVETGQHVIVETARGVEYGQVVLGEREVEDTGAGRKREGFTRGRSCWVTGGHSAEGCKRFEWMKPVRKGY